MMSILNKFTYPYIPKKKLRKKVIQPFPSRKKAYLIDPTIYFPHPNRMVIHYSTKNIFKISKKKEIPKCSYEVHQGDSLIEQHLF